MWACMAANEMGSLVFIEAVTADGGVQNEL